MLIISDVHGQGHFHFKKMKEVIEKEFHIRNLANKTHRHISPCIKCIQKGDTSLDTFHIDHHWNKDSNIETLQVCPSSDSWIFKIFRNNSET